jgi:FKBP-type peptidyl-prolyl cis-trans isomerase FklB
VRGEIILQKKGVNMKFKWVAVLGVLLMASLTFAEENVVLKDQKDKMSYSVGVDIGNSLKNLPVGVNLDLVVRGISDVLSASKFLMTEQEIRETMTVLQKELMDRYTEQMKVIGEKNKKEGELFLAVNKKKEGVITLPSGLQYRVLKAGTGKTPTDDDTVTVHYQGTLTDRTEFDSSYRRGQPGTFAIKGVLPGWREALKLMQEGAKWEIFIPPNLAYGERGAGSLIGPNATLIFEVELISIQEKK